MRNPKVLPELIVAGVAPPAPVDRAGRVRDGLYMRLPRREAVPAVRAVVRVEGLVVVQEVGGCKGVVTEAAVGGWGCAGVGGLEVGAEDVVRVGVIVVGVDVHMDGGVDGGARVDVEVGDTGVAGGWPGLR